MNRPNQAVGLTDVRKQLLKLMLTDPEIMSLVFKDSESWEKSTFDDSGTLTIRRGKSSWISRLFGEERQVDFSQLINIIFNSLVKRSPPESQFHVIGMEAIGKYVMYNQSYDMVVDIFFDHMRRTNTALRSIQLALGQSLKEQGLLHKVGGNAEQKKENKDGGGQGNKDQNNNKGNDQNKDKGNQDQKKDQNQNKGDGNKDQNQKQKDGGNKDQNQQQKKPSKEPTTMEELARIPTAVDLGGGQTANLGDLITTIKAGEKVQNREEEND
jgi:hypothetical protein